MRNTLLTSFIKAFVPLPAFYEEWHDKNAGQFITQRAHGCPCCRDLIYYDIMLGYPVCVPQAMSSTGAVPHMRPTRISGSAICSGRCATTAICFRPWAGRMLYVQHAKYQLVQKW